MIRGENITLRVVQEKDLETLFRYSSDLDNRGAFFPLGLPSEAVFKHDFHQHGFWREHRGRLVIVDQADVILGSIWFYQPNSYFDALEIGYLLFDRGSPNKGYVTEALSLLARYLFATRKIRRLQLTVVVGNLASKRVAEKCGFTSSRSSSWLVRATEKACISQAASFAVHPLSSFSQKYACQAAPFLGSVLKVRCRFWEVKETNEVPEKGGAGEQPRLR